MYGMAASIIMSCVALKISGVLFTACIARVLAWRIYCWRAA